MGDGGEAAEISGRLQWKFRDALILDRRPFACSPAVTGSRFLIASDNHKLYCAGLEKGELHWTFEAQCPIFSSPAVWQGRVYIGEGLHYDTDCRFYCLDLASGDILWSVQTTSHTESSPAVVDGKEYFGAGDDGVYCADALSGKILWQYEEPHVDGGPLVVKGRVYVGSGYNYQGLLCLDAADGALLWKKDFRAPVWGAPSMADDRLYIAVGNGNFNESAPEPYGEVRCLDLQDGRDIWRFTDVTDGIHTSVAVSAGRAVFGCRYSLDANTGKLIWRVDIESPVLSSPAIAAGRVFFGADDGLFRCLDLADGLEIWSFDTIDDMLVVLDDPRIQSSPAVVGQKVIFGASNGNVYCLGGEAAADTAPAVVTQTTYRSRLMRGADFTTVGLIEWLGGLTGSFGWAIILTALMVKLILLPLDLKQIGQLRRMRQLQPAFRRLEREYVDYRIHRYEVRALYAREGIHPLAVLGMVLLQVPVLIIVILVVQSTPAFAGKGFLWISDLAATDRLAQMPWSGAGSGSLNLLPILLAGSVLIYARSLDGKKTGSRFWGGLVWLLVAAGLGLLTYAWSAAVLLFVIALFWIGIVELRVLSSPSPSKAAPGE